MRTPRGQYFPTQPLSVTRTDARDRKPTDMRPALGEVNVRPIRADERALGYVDEAQTQLLYQRLVAGEPTDPWITPHIEAQAPLAWITETADVSERTLWRWLARYRAEGIAGLEWPVRVDRGQNREVGTRPFARKSIKTDRRHGVPQIAAAQVLGHFTRSSWPASSCLMAPPLWQSWRFGL